MAFSSCVSYMRITGERCTAYVRSADDYSKSDGPDDVFILFFIDTATMPFLFSLSLFLHRPTTTVAFLFLNSLHGVNYFEDLSISLSSTTMISTTIMSFSSVPLSLGNTLCQPTTAHCPLATDHRPLPTDHRAPPMINPNPSLFLRTFHELYIYLRKTSDKRK